MSPFFFPTPAAMDALNAAQAKASYRSLAHCPCGLQRTCKTPHMRMTGKGSSGIFVLTEAPNKVEDEQGVQLIGKTGQFLRNHLHEVSEIDLDQHCWKMNAVNCRPPSGRKPTLKEITACRPTVLAAIKTARPRVILMLGPTAVESIVGHLNPACASLPLNRGIAVPLHELGCWGVTTWHPSYVERLAFDKALTVVWRQDIALAARISKVPLPMPINANGVKVLRDPYEALDLLHRFAQKPPKCLAFDYETTGLKPDAPHHRIVSLAVSPCSGKAWAFPWTGELREAWVRVLRDKRILKAAHNKTMEQRWSAKMLGAVATPCVDTALLAHVADNRRSFTALDDQAWVRFGFPYWGKKLERFMKPSTEERQLCGANAINRISDAPMMELLKYNAIDALVTRELVNWHVAEGIWNYADCM